MITHQWRILANKDVNQIAPLKSLFHKQSVNTYVPLIDTKYGNRTVFTLGINAHISHILICDEHIYVTHPQRTILKRPFRSFPNKPLDIRHRLCISNKKYRQFPGTHRVESWTLINLSQDDGAWYGCIADADASWCLRSWFQIFLSMDIWRITIRIPEWSPGYAVHSAAGNA